MTRSPSESELRDDRLVAGFTALAVAVHILESAVPMPLPGIKPGLANLVVLVVLLRHGLRLAAWVALLRVLVAALATGTFLTPTFALSAAGALGSIAALGAVHALGRGAVGAVGYSAASATAHMAAQIALAWTLFLPVPALLRLAPALLAVALGLGIAGGILARIVLLRLPPPTRPSAAPDARPAR
jgi:heptaprenyl diphosphate synthase